MSEAEAVADERTLAGLTAFKRDILWTLAAEGEQKGVDIRISLEDYYDKPVNHGQLYPNLDELVDAGLVDKGEIDGRTNSYSLTEAGRRALTQRQTWQATGSKDGESDDSEVDYGGKA